MNIVERFQKEVQSKRQHQVEGKQNIYTALQLQLQVEYQEIKNKLPTEIRDEIKRMAQKYPNFQKYALYNIYKQFDFNKTIANEFIAIQILAEEQAQDDGWIEVMGRRQFTTKQPTQRSQSAKRQEPVVQTNRSNSMDRKSKYRAKTPTKSVKQVDFNRRIEPSNKVVYKYVPKLADCPYEVKQYAQNVQPSRYQERVASPQRIVSPPRVPKVVTPQVSAQKSGTDSHKYEPQSSGLWRPVDVSKPCPIEHQATQCVKPIIKSSQPSQPYEQQLYQPQQYQYVPQQQYTTQQYTTQQYTTYQQQPQQPQMIPAYQYNAPQYPMYYTPNQQYAPQEFTYNLLLSYINSSEGV